MNLEQIKTYALEVLTKEEHETFLSYLKKIDTYREKLILQPGDKLKRKCDGVVFTFVDKAPYGFGNVYVEELEQYVHASDFQEIL
ncbi:hypothetical protein ACIQUE_25215 [Bacillus cereus]|uniref:Uncharacterized protein n=1 Tax=Bacillus cereus TaxID=1396 RepID=A0AAN5XN70_BACCE|nr:MULTISPECIES: hypothetical protein [Bacillus cereus group]KAB2447486.1 hypothetical protein F8165_24640 [Bacillus cereus]KAB2485480.1 hypothetical protein F8157_15765 [Bacillus cereus]KMP50010.1 hypothetical protein TU59_22440 [Bacillus cereus]MDA2411356.1 hypothetical protein [Bacillus cereus]MED2869139.1 hypothetical protein [Bacillus thuringiensis]